jgi:hypothetical protein
VKIFDGKTFKGWEVDTAFWKVENGVAVARFYPAKPSKQILF